MAFQKLKDSILLIGVAEVFKEIKSEEYLLV